MSTSVRCDRSPSPGPLQQAMTDYLALRRALGHDLVEAGWLLPGFVAYLDAHDCPTVTIEAALAWAQQAPTPPRSPTGRVSTIGPRRMTAARGFARYLAGTDASTQVPPLGLMPHRARWRGPFIHSPAEVDRVREQARQTIVSPLRAATYDTLIGLLAVSGQHRLRAVRRYRPARRVSAVRASPARYSPLPVARWSGASVALHEILHRGVGISPSTPKQAAQHHREHSNWHRLSYSGCSSPVKAAMPYLGDGGTVVISARPRRCRHCPACLYGGSKARFSLTYSNSRLWDGVQAASWAFTLVQEADDEQLCNEASLPLSSHAATSRGAASSRRSMKRWPGPATPQRHTCCARAISASRSSAGACPSRDRLRGEVLQMEGRTAGSGELLQP